MDIYLNGWTIKDGDLKLILIILLMAILYLLNNGGF